MGLDIELEHGLVDPNTNVTDDDEIITGKIALAHLNEFPDYYTRLEKWREKQRENSRYVRKYLLLIDKNIFLLYTILVR